MNEKKYRNPNEAFNNLLLTKQAAGKIFYHYKFFTAKSIWCICLPFYISFPTQTQFNSTKALA
jgi:hypothetical protein